MSDKFTTRDERASYGVGLQIGEQLAGQVFEGMKVDALLEGIADVLEDRPRQLDEDELREALEDLNARMLHRQQQSGDAAAGRRFLEENARREEVFVTGSGLQYEVLEQGEGASPGPSSRVKVHYHGTLVDGSVFDSSMARGEPVELPVNGVIAGWTEALQLMRPGDRWKLYVPDSLAYGASGAGNVIPAGAALIFDLQLLEVK